MLVMSPLSNGFTTTADVAAAPLLKTVGVTFQRPASATPWRSLALSAASRPKSGLTDDGEPVRAGAGSSAGTACAAAGTAGRGATADRRVSAGIQ